MKKTLYLHIGYPKTGTTTVQKHFFPKIEEIQYLGKFDNENKLFSFDVKIIDDLIFKTEGKIGLEPNMKEFCQYTESPKICISEESFTSNSLRTSIIKSDNICPPQEQIAKNLRIFFNDERFDVKILCTIRKQDEMITSQYAQSYVHYYSRFKETSSFKKFLDLYLNDKNFKHTYVKTLDYYHVIGIYEEQFGKDNIKILVFEELQNNPRQFYEKLCDYLGVNRDKYYKIAIRKVENKRSADQKYKKTRYISVFDKLFMVKNKYLPFVKVGTPPKIKNKLKKIKWTDNQKISKTIFLNNDEKDKILDKYKNSNKKLDKEYNLKLKEYGYYND